MALVLVVAGVYSVVAQVVVERRHDLAIRSALGAGPRRVVTTAMQSALRPTAIGIALGGLAAMGASRVLTSLLFEVSALDVATWDRGYTPLFLPPVLRQDSCLGDELPELIQWWQQGANSRGPEWLAS